MVRNNDEVVPLEIRAHFLNPPNDGEPLFFSDAVISFVSVESAARVSHDAFFVVVLLREHGAETGLGCIGLQEERFSEVEASTGTVVRAFFR